MLKQLLISTALTIGGYFSKNSPELQPEQQIDDQLEPQAQWDAWDRMLHHDDVTADEIKLLNSDNPEDILAAQESIFERQREFQQMWDDKDSRKELFYETILKNQPEGTEETPMDQKLGWEDDDEGPETFYYRCDITGELKEQRFDELPEWQNNKVNDNE